MPEACLEKDQGFFNPILCRQNPILFPSMAPSFILTASHN